MDDEERKVRAHEALLQRFLGYVVGSLAVFLPLLDFSIASDQEGHLALPPVAAEFFVTIGTVLTILLSGSALVRFRQALFLEQDLKFDVSSISGLGETRSYPARVGNWLTQRALGRGAKVADTGVNLAMLLILVMLLTMVATLPWPRL